MGTGRQQQDEGVSLIAARWKASILVGAVISPFLLAGCSQTTSHGMSVAKLTDSIGPTKVRPYRYTARDRECMERVMFFESNRSSRDGMIAVGTVVMNRLRSGKHGNSICAVVGEKGQFAPGVMTRRMNSKALPDVQEAAEAVLKGERHAKMRSAMYFHTAGLKFPYKNMHYVAVAGGNAFYEKRGRNWKPLPPEPTIMVAAAAPAARTTTVQAKAQGQPVVLASAQTDAMTTAAVSSVPLPQARPDGGRVVLARAIGRDPDPARFGTAATAHVVAASYSAPSDQPVMAFEQTPENTSAIGALIAAESRPMSK
jgi:spore germination cell wall hydrolase CwlJ-like protein